MWEQAWLEAQRGMTKLGLGKAEGKEAGSQRGQPSPGSPVETGAVSSEKAQGSGGQFGPLWHLALFESQARGCRKEQGSGGRLCGWAANGSADKDP